MAAFGFRISGKFYSAEFTGDAETDSRAQIAEFARQAGTSMAAFEFARECANRSLGLRGDNEGFFKTLTRGGFEPSDEPDYWIDFDDKVLMDSVNGRGYDLEWMGRGGSMDVPAFAKDNLTGHSVGVANPDESFDQDDEDYVDDIYLEDSDIDPSEQNIVASQTKAGSHRPLIDLDFDAALLPSSAPGHWHLYLDKTMDAETYQKFVECLRDFGIVADGNVNQVERKGSTFLRLPWIRKGADRNLVSKKSRAELAKMEKAFQTLSDAW